MPLLILAAGASRRFGDTDKRFVSLPKGGSLLPALVRRGRKAGLDVKVVLAAAAEDSVAVARRLECDCLFAENAERGMASSIADGIAQLRKSYRDEHVPEPDAVLLMPADLPLIRIHSLRAVAAAAAADVIVQPHCASQVGHPVAFGRQFWSALMALSGDGGARSLVSRHQAALRPLALADEGIYRDGDTPEQMAEILALLDPPD